IVQILLQEGADINAQGGDHGTALCTAAALDERVEIVRILLQEGADINAQGGYYGTALGAAASKGNTEIVRKLLQEGADIYARGSSKGPALQQAVNKHREGAVQVLLDASVDNRYQDIWDTMCDDLKRKIRELERHERYNQLLEGVRNIQKMLDQWLAKQESKKKVDVDVEEKSEDGADDSRAATTLTIRETISDQML
ncbi:Ankyrin repeat and SOCS box protein, partial [Lachnellula occidentalis]